METEEKETKSYADWVAVEEGAPVTSEHVVTAFELLKEKGHRPSIYKGF